MMIEKTARVTAVQKERYELSCEGERLYGKLKPSVYFNSGTENYPAAGDQVTILYNPTGDSIILRTHPRTSFFSRLDPDKTRPREQAVAANFDYVFILMSMNQDFNLRRLERYLTLSWNSGAAPVVVLTKADLAEDAGSCVQQAAEAAAGAQVCAVSVVTGYGLDALSPYLAPGKTIVLLGSSGVGKSSLLNCLAGEHLMDTGDIRLNDGKGRHTTTHRQLITLASGAHVIDTPGMRELGLWDAAEGLSGVFADVEALTDRCRFSDCRHETEPGCAVRKAMESGALSLERWQSYQKLQREARFADDKAAALREKRAWAKAISKAHR